MPEPIDPSTLAVTARRSLAQAATATLLIDGIGRLGPGDGDIVLDELDGRPRFLCAGDSAVARAAVARRRAILSVAQSGRRLDVVLAGHLAEAGEFSGGAQSDATRSATRIVELRLVSVVVELTESDPPVVRAHQVPLHEYLTAYGEQAGSSPTSTAADLRCAAGRLLGHTNAHHADRLRALAAVSSAQPTDRVLQARLTRIDATGVELGWIDVDGAHTRMLDFPRVALDAEDLAVLVRCRLTGGSCR